MKETETSHLHMNKSQSLVKLPIYLSFLKKVRIEDIFGHARNYFTFSAKLLRSYSGMLQPWTKKGKTMEPRRQWSSQKNNKGRSLDDNCAIALESNQSSKELKVRFQKEPLPKIRWNMRDLTYSLTIWNTLREWQRQKNAKKRKGNQKHQGKIKTARNKMVPNHEYKY